MPASVRGALQEVFQHEGKLSADDSEQMLLAMERSGRLQSETWSWSSGHQKPSTTHTTPARTPTLLYIYEIELYYCFSMSYGI